MKNGSRLISAAYITVVFILAYRVESVFRALFIAWMMVCLAEIWVVVMLRPYQMRLTACKPYWAWQCELTVLIVASILCLILRKEELGFIAVLSFLSDTGAIAFGKLLGKHKARLVNGISPYKTVEGYIGAFLCPFLVFIVNHFLFRLDVSIPLLVFVSLGGLCAGAGDLLGSASKRQMALKDSGSVLATLPVFNVIEWPMKGMGGYLDRFDSISLNILLYVLIMPRQ